MSAVVWTEGGDDPLAFIRSNGIGVHVQPRQRKYGRGKYKRANDRHEDDL